MAETSDQSSISAPLSLMSRGKFADQRTPNTETVDDNFQSSASRNVIVQREKDINAMAGGIHNIIDGQSSPISLLRPCRPIKKLKWARAECEGELAEEVAEEDCVTPRGREQRIPQEILICPPPPRKKRRTTSPPLNYCKRKLNLSYDIIEDAMPPASDPSSASITDAHYLHRQRRHYRAALQVVVNPPDLHTFPECIRALFSA